MIVLYNTDTYMLQRQKKTSYYTKCYSVYNKDDVKYMYMILYNMLNSIHMKDSLKYMTCTTYTITAGGIHTAASNAG